MWVLETETERKPSPARASFFLEAATPELNQQKQGATTMASWFLLLLRFRFLFFLTCRSVEILGIELNGHQTMNTTIFFTRKKRKQSALHCKKERPAHERKKQRPSLSARLPPSFPLSPPPKKNLMKEQGGNAPHPSACLPRLP